MMYALPAMPTYQHEVTVGKSENLSLRPGLPWLRLCRLRRALLVFHSTEYGVHTVKVVLTSQVLREMYSVRILQNVQVRSTGTKEAGGPISLIWQPR